MPVLTSYFPDGTSLQTIEHFAQMINNGGNFRQFDYGQENLLRYNSSVPPEYEVWKITLPIYLFIGKEDFLAPKEVRYKFYIFVTLPLRTLNIFENKLYFNLIEKFL